MSKYLTAARDELNYLLENYVGRDVPDPANVHLAIIANLLSHIEVQNTEASIQRSLEQIKVGEVVDIDWKGSQETDALGLAAQVSKHWPNTFVTVNVSAAGTTDAEEQAADPDPLDESNHADRYDNDGDRWEWCDRCDGFRVICSPSGHLHGFGAWIASLASIDNHFGPLTFAPDPVHDQDNQRSLTPDYSTDRMHLVYRGDDGTYYYQPWQDVAEVGGLVDPETDEDRDLVGWTTKVDN